jgi:hypothetical protein
MQERGDIECKTSGKQIIYLVKQVSIAVLGYILTLYKDVQSTYAEDRAELDKQLSETSTAVDSGKGEQRQILAELAVLESAITLSDLKLLSSELEMAVTNLEARLSNLRSGSFTPITTEEKELNEKRDSRIKRVSRNRQDIHREEWEILCEHFLADGETATELWVSFGSSITSLTEYRHTGEDGSARATLM